MLAVAQSDLRDSHLVRVFEGAFEQVEGLDPDILGLEVVGGFDVKPKRHLVTLDEFDDIDRPGGLEGELVQIFLVDQDELILSDLVALEHLVECDHVVIRRAMPLLFDRELTMGAQLSEGHGAVRLGGEVHADRDRHHPEADRAPPHGPGHTT